METPVNPMLTLTIANLRGILFGLNNPNNMTVADLMYELKRLDEGVDITKISALKGVEILNSMHRSGIQL